MPERGAAHAAAAAVLDPELPVLTLADLGVLRDVEEHAEAAVVTITPTYTGCPALAEIRADLRRAIMAAGYTEVEVRTVLAPAWSTDDITPAGRAKLLAAGIAPPGPAPRHPVPLHLDAPQPVRCPRCSSTQTRLTSRFGPTACTSLWCCNSCAEPFERVKEL